MNSDVSNEQYASPPWLTDSIYSFLPRRFLGTEPKEIAVVATTLGQIQMLCMLTARC